MAVCTYCDQEMTLHVGCTQAVYDDFPDGVERTRIPYGDPRDLMDSPNANCHDCGVPRGTFHHPGCDAEACPLCGGQAISCECTDDEDDEDVEDNLA